jgi:rod shape-determining protein MreD
MQNFFIGTIIFLSVMMQTSFLSNIFPSGYVPDSALIFIIIWTARIDFNSGLRWAIFGGLIMDLMSYYPVGINIFSFAAIAFVANSLSKRFLVPQLAWKFVVLAGIVFLATMINQVVTEFLTGLVLQKDLGESFHSIFNSRLLWKPFYNLLIFAIMYWPIRKLDKFFSYNNQRIVIKRHA